MIKFTIEDVEPIRENKDIAEYVELDETVAMKSCKKMCNMFADVLEELAK